MRPKPTKQSTITKADVEERLVTLRAKLYESRSLSAAYDGAVQDCEHWLAFIEQKEKEEVQAED